MRRSSPTLGATKVTNQPFSLHDATLVSVRLDWASGACWLEFAGSPDHPGPFHLRFEHVEELAVPKQEPWGRSVSVLEFREVQQGRYEIVMQSGDTLVVVAPNMAFKADWSKRRSPWFNLLAVSRLAPR